MDVNEYELHGLYAWIDGIPISRPKKNLSRDFSDGVPMAEVMHYYFPKVVQMHNYSSTFSVNKKIINWERINSKIFKRLGFSIEQREIEDVCNSKSGSIERVLKLVRIKVTEIIAKQNRNKKEVASSSEGSNDMEEFCFSPGALVPQKETMTTFSEQLLPTYHSSTISQSKIPKPSQNNISSIDSNLKDTTDTSQEVTPRSEKSNGSVKNIIHSKTPIPAPVSKISINTRRSSVSLSPTPKKYHQHKNMQNKSISGLRIDETKAQNLIVAEIQERNNLLEAKIEKLEALLKLKDAKIEALLKKLELQT